MNDLGAQLLERLRNEAPWLFEPALRCCIVGSAALAEACRREEIDGPAPKDIDFSWALDVEAGEALLQRHGVLRQVTDLARGRGTLAFGLGKDRFEITSFRGRGEDALLGDLGARDATINAIAWKLSNDRILDPQRGLDDWKAGRLRPVGAADERIDEHPIRWLRFRRQAHAQALEIDPSIRKIRFQERFAEEVPPEAWAAEFRRGLLESPSPGAFVVELHEGRALHVLAPELAEQFDGLPAGPIRYHPEISQALHLALALDWAADRTRELEESERLDVLVATLCHDLGKNLTPPEVLPSHPGHEEDGLPLVDRLLDRLPGLTDQGGRRLAKLVCALHLSVRRIGEMRSGTLAQHYEKHYRGKDFPLRTFALAVAADVGGRLHRGDEGDAIRAQVERDLTCIREAAAAVDAGALRSRFPDVDEFRDALHQERARAIASALKSRA